MKKHIYDEKNGLSYTLHGDYYLTDLLLPEEEPVIIGKYGRLHRTFLKEHKRIVFTQLLTQGSLMKYLNQIDRKANEREELLIGQMVESQGVTEQLKADNQMIWVGKINQIRNAAEEIVLKELIYV
ncbi:TnpV protein [Robinsoniella sp. RHS]|uniref:TnpV protein n=1 Tax=Robinsoniella sp. RHS TaxID=1504536 RepID=UPI00064B2432